MAAAGTLSRQTGSENNSETWELFFKLQNHTAVIIIDNVTKIITNFHFVP